MSDDALPARDHRRLGPALDLYSFSEHAPGMALWHPRGMIVRNELARLLRELYRVHGYDEVSAPVAMDAALWERSGHLANFREHVFFLEAHEGRSFALKPMNCPGHALIFAARPRSISELPLRYAEFSPLHRLEPSGALCGLKRARGFVVDDAHVFCREDQVRDEVLRALDLAREVYRVLGFSFRARLALRPARSIGSDAQWARAESALREALAAAGLAHDDRPGEGAFYGPKIELEVEDALGRGWQCGTVQLDWNLPERFDLSFRGSDGAAHRPVIVHRAALGSFERLIAILLEHGEGALPPWLAPEQVRVLPVGDPGYARGVVESLARADLRAGLEAGPARLPKRIRDALLARVPYVLVVGEREAAAGSVSVRARGEAGAEEMPLAAFVARVQEAVARRSA